MGIHHPSYLFRESAEPPKVPIPLEARKMHFCSVQLPNPTDDPNSIQYEKISQWTVLHPDKAGIVIPKGYESRHDMIHGGHLSRTASETEIDGYVQALVREGGKLEGWLPRSENFCGAGRCFDVIFLRQKTYGCTIDEKVLARIPDEGMTRWVPLPEPVMRWVPQRIIRRVPHPGPSRRRWADRAPLLGPELLRWPGHVARVTPEPVTPEPETMRPEPQQQETEASESAPAPESSSENQSPGEDATSDDDSEYLPGARSMRIRRRVETEAMIRQMRRFDVALNESQNENNARDLVDLVMERRRLRGVL